MTRPKLFNALACYLAIIALVFAFSVLRVRQQNSFAAQIAPDTLPEYPSYTQTPDENSKPFFSLLTNRTSAATDRTRLWLNYHGIDQLEFRVYKVRNPVEFFKGLACYLAVIVLVFAFSVLRVRQQNSFAAQIAPDTLPEYPSYTQTSDICRAPAQSARRNCFAGARAERRRQTQAR